MLEKEKAIEKLNEKEIKVYQYILAHSLEFPFMTIRELADKVQVSTTVILNYVKKMGYKSFKEFKLAYRLQERKSRESKRIYDDKQVIGALIQLDNEYYQEKLHLAKVMIGNHNNLIFTGVGNSGLIGAYGARIFSSAGKYANVINDPFMRINASMEDITKQYSFTYRLPNEMDDTVLYGEPSLQGNAVIAVRTQEAPETPVNLELLFNAVTLGKLK